MDISKPSIQPFASPLRQSAGTASPASTSAPLFLSQAHEADAFVASQPTSATPPATTATHVTSSPLPTATPANDSKAPSSADAPRAVMSAETLARKHGAVLVHGFQPRGLNTSFSTDGADRLREMFHSAALTGGDLCASAVLPGLAQGQTLGGTTVGMVLGRAEITNAFADDINSAITPTGKRTMRTELYERLQQKIPFPEGVREGTVRYRDGYGTTGEVRESTGPIYSTADRRHSAEARVEQALEAYTERAGDRAWVHHNELFVRKAEPTALFVDGRALAPLEGEPSIFVSKPGNEAAMSLLSHGAERDLPLTVLDEKGRFLKARMMPVSRSLPLVEKRLDEVAERLHAVVTGTDAQADRMHRDVVRAFGDERGNRFRQMLSAEVKDAGFNGRPTLENLDVDRFIERVRRDTDEDPRDALWSRAVEWSKENPGTRVPDYYTSSEFRLEMHAQALRTAIDGVNDKLGRLDVFCDASDRLRTSNHYDRELAQYSREDDTFATSDEGKRLQTATVNWREAAFKLYADGAQNLFGERPRNVEPLDVSQASNAWCESFELASDVKGLGRLLPEGPVSGIRLFRVGDEMPPEALVTAPPLVFSERETKHLYQSLQHSYPERSQSYERGQQLNESRRTGNDHRVPLTSSIVPVALYESAERRVDGHIAAGMASHLPSSGEIFTPAPPAPQGPNLLQRIGHVLQMDVKDARMHLTRDRWAANRSVRPEPYVARQTEAPSHYMARSNAMRLTPSDFEAFKRRTPEGIFRHEIMRAHHDQYNRCLQGLEPAPTREQGIRLTASTRTSLERRTNDVALRDAVRNLANRSLQVHADEGASKGQLAYLAELKHDAILQACERLRDVHGYTQEKMLSVLRGEAGGRDWPTPTATLTNRESRPIDQIW